MHKSFTYSAEHTPSNWTHSWLLPEPAYYCPTSR